MSEQKPQTPHTHLGVIDSALAIAFITAACYMTGYMRDLLDARRLGLPLHLLPEHSIESILFTGGSYLFFFSLLLLLIGLIGVLVSKAFSESIRKKKLKRLREAYDAHPKIYLILGFAVFLSSFMILPRLAPIRNEYMDKFLPHVISIDGKPQDDEKLLYLSNRDGLIVLKKLGLKSYVILQQDDTMSIEVSIESPK